VGDVEKVTAYCDSTSLAPQEYLRWVRASRGYITHQVAVQLDPAQYWQVHRSTIVKLQHLAGTRRDEVSRLFVLMNGYGLYRQLSDFGWECQVVALSLIPKKAGDRVNTDRRDSLSLARLHRAKELTEVWVWYLPTMTPSPYEAR
jgi:transposase